MAPRRGGGRAGRRWPRRWRASSQIPSATSGIDRICEVDSQPNSTPRSSARHTSTSDRNTPLPISSQANTSPWKRLRGRNQKYSAAKVSRFSPAR